MSTVHWNLGEKMLIDEIWRQIINLKRDGERKRENNKSKFNVEVIKMITGKQLNYDGFEFCGLELN